MDSLGHSSLPPTALGRQDDEEVSPGVDEDGLNACTCLINTPNILNPTILPTKREKMRLRTANRTNSCQSNSAHINPRGKVIHKVTIEEQQPSMLNRGHVAYTHSPIEASFAQSLVEACPVIVRDVTLHKRSCRRQ
ncbi:hypothetical protein TNCV_1479561 [Trichonephila clavipes]|nr:hypothetical protein TNCV_1479561 [Trichonephila clavipes]